MSGSSNGKGAATGRRIEARGKPTTVKAAPGTQAYWTRSFLGSALVLLAAALLALALLAKRDTDVALEHLGRVARVLAEGIGAELARVRALVASAAMDRALQDALTSTRPDSVSAAELGLQGRIPGALSVHLFPAERIHSVEGIPFMSYAGLDLARQAAQTRRVPPVEVHKLGQPDMHLAITGPVFDGQGDRVLGVLHLALPMSLLPRLDDLVEGSNSAAYGQVVGGKAVPLNATAPLPDAAPDRVVAIPESRLEISLWLGPKVLPDPWLLGLAAALYLVTLGAIGTLLWLSHRGLRRDLREDLQGLVLMVEDARHLRPIRQPRSRLAETQRTQAELMAQLRALGSSQGARTAGAEAGPGPESGLATLRNRSRDESSDWTGLDDSGEPEGQEALDALDEMEELELPDALDAQATPAAILREPGRVPSAIFRAYDIRGLVERQLSADAAQAIGQALGSAALAAGDRTLMIGRDCRPSSPALSAALAAGIRGAGLEVVDLGVVPTPLVYFACCHPERRAGAVVTGSHNPPEYNGVKPVLGGRSATAEEIQALRHRIEAGELARGSGGYRQMDPIPPYRAYIERDVALARPLRIAIDCGNATASVIAPDLYRALGCDVIERHCDLGAGLGEHIADPAMPEYLGPLGRLVVEEQADLGLAFDGDGDRLGVVDSAGQFIPADRVLMLLAADVLSRNPGTDVIFDVKCSTHLAEEIRRAGGRPVMWRSGHTPLKARLRDGGALIAGELSGHLMFQERWFGFDDAIYAGARLLEVLSLDPRSSQEIFSALPSGVVTPELALPLEEGEPARVMDAVIQKAGELEGAELILIDGLRAEFEAGWGLVRASNTQPKLTFRFEGNDPEALKAIQTRFRRLLDLAAPGLKPPF